MHLTPAATALPFPDLTRRGARRRSSASCAYLERTARGGRGGVSAGARAAGAGRRRTVVRHGERHVDLARLVVELVLHRLLAGDELGADRVGLALRRRRQLGRELRLQRAAARGGRERRERGSGRAEKAEEMLRTASSRPSCARGAERVSMRPKRGGRALVGRWRRTAPNEPRSTTCTPRGPA